MATIRHILRCDQCKVEFETTKDEYNRDDNDYPIQDVSIGFNTYPTSWAGGGNGGPPPRNFHGIQLGEICHTCRCKAYIAIKNVFPNAKVENDG